MVFFFTLASAPDMVCYVGRDKEENELLIEWGWPEDVWFHVDNHSRYGNVRVHMAACIL